jgi:hypothetical protein
MNTAFLLMAQHEKAFIPAEEVVRFYFPHLSLPKFLRKVSEGHIKLPLIATEDSQKSVKGVHVHDMAAYLDARRESAQRDLDRLHS